ncbi:MAG: hypothetical protein GY847_02365 [Proteobacteria bacterium]|nr:hypothetical protein [Pseudomonadota bacterium]
MKNNLQILCGLIILILAVIAENVLAQNVDPSNQVIFGFKIRAGGRYDNVRMCVGSPAGVKGGPALDISLFGEFGVADNISVSIDLPVFRPIFFGAVFSMLQFEPEVTLNFRIQTDGKVDLIAGPSVGMSLHYGPDYNSDKSSDGRGASFFALGPRIGGYFAVDFKRPEETFNFQLGLHPYFTSLFSVNDPEDHRGIVVGGTLDGLFRFTTDI